MNNIPMALSHDDFQAKHSDMLASARAGVLYDPSTGTSYRIDPKWIEPQFSPEFLEMRRRYSEMQDQLHQMCRGAGINRQP